MCWREAYVFQQLHHPTNGCLVILARFFLLQGQLPLWEQARDRGMGAAANNLPCSCCVCTKITAEVPPLEGTSNPPMVPSSPQQTKPSYLSCRPVARTAGKALGRFILGLCHVLSFGLRLFYFCIRTNIAAKISPWTWKAANQKKSQRDAAFHRGSLWLDEFRHGMGTGGNLHQESS